MSKWTKEIFPTKTGSVATIRERHTAEDGWMIEKHTTGPKQPFVRQSYKPCPFKIIDPTGKVRESDRTVTSAKRQVEYLRQQDAKFAAGWRPEGWQEYTV